MKEVLLKLENACQARNSVPETNAFPEESDETYAWKSEMVELMNESLRLWEKEFGNLVHLAQKNGIWKLTPEKGGLRARTMKRYLTLEALPMRPKWRKLIDTVNFVAEKTSSSRASNKLLRQKKHFEQNLIRLRLLHPFNHP